MSSRLAETNGSAGHRRERTGHTDGHEASATSHRTGDRTWRSAKFASRLSRAPLRGTRDVMRLGRVLQMRDPQLNRERRATSRHGDRRTGTACGAPRLRTGRRVNLERHPGKVRSEDRDSQPVHSGLSTKLPRRAKINRQGEPKLNRAGTATLDAHQDPSRCAAIGFV
jgi:hypothetical protein